LRAGEKGICFAAFGGVLYFSIFSKNMVMLVVRIWLFDGFVFWLLGVLLIDDLFIVFYIFVAPRAF